MPGQGTGYVQWSFSSPDTDCDRLANLAQILRCLPLQQLQDCHGRPQAWVGIAMPITLLPLLFYFESCNYKIGRIPESSPLLKAIDLSILVPWLMGQVSPSHFPLTGSVGGVAVQTFLSLPFLAPQRDVGQILSPDSSVYAWVVAISRVDHAIVELCALSSLVFPPTHQWQRL